MVNIKSHFKMGQVVYYILPDRCVIRAYVVGINFHKTLKDKRLEREYWIETIIGDGSPLRAFSPYPRKKLFTSLKEAENKSGLKLYKKPDRKELEE